MIRTRLRGRGRIGSGLNPFAQAGFFAPLKSSLTLVRGIGVATFTRATGATVMGYGPTANLADGMTLLTVDAGEARFSGARRISANNWSSFFADGSAIPDATLKGYLAEGAATNYFLQSGAPATQSITLGVGTYTLGNILGAGTITSSAGTATASGYGVADATTPNTIVVTVAGTVVFTVTGTVTQAQVSNTPFEVSYIPTTTVAVTRNADVENYPTAGNILSASGSIYLEFTPNHAATVATYLCRSFVDGSNFTLLWHDGTNLIFRKHIAGINYDATIANAFASGTRYKIAVTWGSAGTTITLNGVMGTPNANTTATPIAATLEFCVPAQASINIRNPRIWQIPLPAATLQAITL